MAAKYTSTGLYCFSLYNEEFDYSLTSKLSSYPNIANDKVFYGNRAKFRVEVDSAKQATLIAVNITNAQSSLDRATFMRENQNLFF